MSKTSLLLPDERLDLLVRLLSFEDDAHDIGRLRMDLLGDKPALQAMMQAAARRQLMSASIHQLKQKGILPALSAKQAKSGSAMAQLGELDVQFRQRRAVLTNALHAIVESLNAGGITPLILKGSMSLISGKPVWRFQRDIDFAVDPKDGNKAVAALKSAGFRERSDLELRPHHLRPMQRDDVPALIETHVRLAGTRARTALPDTVLMRTVSSHTWQGLNYHAMSNAGFLLHGLAHHHFQNRGFIYGTVSLKGLLEFAHAAKDLQDVDTVELDRITSAHPRMRSALLLWSALAKHLLHLEPPPGPTTPVAAERHADRVASRCMNSSSASPLTGLIEHISSTLRHTPTLSSIVSVLPSVSDVFHRAIRVDPIGQRRNASGVLVDD